MIAPAAFAASRPAGGHDNPFIPITPGWRRVLLGYYLVWLVLTPVLQEITFPSNTPLVALRVTLGVLYQTLVFLPIILYRPSFGWLHPLIFPTLYGIASGLVRTPGELLRPLGIGLAPREADLRIELLPWYSDEVVALGELKLQLIHILALLAYYAGFFLLARGRGGPADGALAPRLSQRRVRQVTIAVAAAGLLGTGYFLVTQGGIQGHLITYWGGGRGSDEAPGVGFTQTALDICIVALLMMYALVHGIQRNPLFSGAVLTSLILSFLVSGSRSSLFYGIVLFVLVWMLRHRKVPTGRAATIVALALVLLGPLGTFRQTVANTSRVDWSALDLRGAVSRTNAEIAKRSSRTGGVPVMVRVPSEVGLLKGKSYVGGLLFFVPRVLWENKPHGAAYYNNTVILGRGEFGVPIPPEAEAYWNFDIPGVIVVFLLFGVFHRYLTGLFTRHGHNPAMWVPYILALFYLVPSSLMLTHGARVLGASMLMLAAMGAWKPGASRPESRPQPPRVHGFRVPVAQPES